MGLDIVVIPTVDQKEGEDPLPNQGRKLPLMVVQMSDELVDKCGGVLKIVCSLMSGVSIATDEPVRAHLHKSLLGEPVDDSPLGGALSPDELNDLLTKGAGEAS